MFAKFQQRAAVATLDARSATTNTGRVSAAMRDPHTGFVRFGRAALLVRRREGEGEHRMTQDQRRKLAASVTAGTEHPHRYLIHKECIIMQSLDVNALELVAPAHLRFFDTSREERCEPKK